MNKTIKIENFEFEEFGNVLMSKDGDLMIFDTSLDKTGVAFLDADITKYSNFITNYIIVSLDFRTIFSTSALNIRQLSGFPELEKLSIDLHKGTTFEYSINQNNIFSSVKKLDIKQVLPDNFIDFDNFQNVRKLSFDYSKKILKNVSKLKLLQDLIIFDYNEKDLLALNKVTSIVRLTLISGHISSLNGIESLPNLKTLRIVKGKRLLDISSINNSTTLENLMFEDYKNIKNWSFLSKNHNLKCLYIDSSEDFKFINNFKSLNYFFCKQALNLGGKHVFFVPNEKNENEKNLEIIDWMPPCDAFYAEI